MLTIPKNILNDVKNGESIAILENYLLTNYSMGDIIKAFAELIVTSDEYVNRPQITVSQEEYDSIMSLFKVRGIRMTMSGEVVEERRGIPKGVRNFINKIEKPSEDGDNSYKLDL